MRDRMQPRIEEANFYCKNVKKSQWPANCPGWKIEYETPAMVVKKDEEGRDYVCQVTQHLIQLKKAAVHSPDICLDDLREPWQVQDVMKNTERVMEENAKWVWANALQNDTLELCENHLVTREIFEGVKEAYRIAERNGAAISDLKILSQGKVVQFPPRVNFWGKRVYPYTSTKSGEHWGVNPKYKKAAEQILVWHPEIVEFLFPDVKNWSGDLFYRNIPSAEYNLNGTIGFFRMLFSYAAKPLRPDLGTVITVLPPGLKGLLWYWAWKIVGFKP